MLPDITDQRRARALEIEMQSIQPFLSDPHVHDVMLNADGSIWVDRAGTGMARTGATMRPDQAESMLKTIAAVGRRELGPQAPSLQTDLPSLGLRVQGLLPPIVSAPIFALRKPAALIFPLDHYVERGILPSEGSTPIQMTSSTGWAARWRARGLHASASLLDKLRHAVLLRANILIGGGTGTGKTTFANAVLRELGDSGDRIFLVEDTPELRCAAQNRVSVRITPRLYSWQDAIADAMRLRPDRIVVGEVRDGAALELLKAWNTGHPGGLATIHANDAAGMLERVCQLIEEVVHPAPRRFVAEAINVVVHLERDGRHPAGRRVSTVALVEGVTPDGTWQLSSL